MQHLKVIIRALTSCPTRDLQNSFRKLMVIFSSIPNSMNVATEGSVSSFKSWPGSPHVPCASSLPHHADSMTTDHKRFKNFIHTAVEMGTHVILEMEGELWYWDPPPHGGLTSVPSRFMSTQNPRM